MNDIFPTIELGVKKLQIGESVFNGLPAISFLRWYDESNPTIDRIAEPGEVEAVITFATRQSMVNLRTVLDMLLQKSSEPASHEQRAIEAIGLAYGLLWMTKAKSETAQNAWEFLKASLDRPAKKAGIEAAMKAGFFVDGPSEFE